MVRISNEKIPTMDLAKFSQQLPSEGFDEIVLDESQDITAIEFEMLKRLLIGHNLRRLVFAGDPLQTLNPTGFDWNRIRAMFEDGGVNRNDIKVEKFYNNYRSQKKIVEFANAIQLKRGELFGEKERTVMQAKRGGTEKIRFIRYNLAKENHMQAIGDIIKNAGESKAIVITSAPDDTGIKDLLSENSLLDAKDPVMQHVWQNKRMSSEEEIDASNFRKELYIHSSSSVKGAEYDVVVLYRFASSESARESLVSLLQEWNQMGKVEKEQGIKIRYEYSKLYVALTRAFSRIYLIEDPDGYDFWKNVKLYDHGEILTDIGSFIDFEDYLDPLKSVNSEDLRPEIEANRENYNEERNKFLKDPTNVIALEYAIGLGKRLLNKEKDLEIEKQLDDLQGEYAWYQSREPQRSEKEKSRLLEVALNFFTKAKSYDKAGPIYYSSKKFEKCLTNVQDFPTAERLVQVSKSCVRVARLFGFDPKVAFLSHSTFGEPATDRTKRLSDAVEILKKSNVNFKFDGEMQPDVALEEMYKELYPFSEIVGNSNVLIMPSQHSAAISYKMIKSMSRAKVIGPLLIGLGQPIEIAPLRSSTSDIINLASIAAYSADVINYKKN